MRRIIIIILGILVAIAVLAQEETKFPAQDQKSMKKTPLEIDLPSEKKLLMYPNLRMISNLQCQNDIFLVYSKPYCCRNWTWGVTLAVHGERSFSLSLMARIFNPGVRH